MPQCRGVMSHYMTSSACDIMTDLGICNNLRESLDFLLDPGPLYRGEAIHDDSHLASRGASLCSVPEAI